VGTSFHERPDRWPAASVDVLSRFDHDLTEQPFTLERRQQRSSLAPQADHVAGRAFGLPLASVTKCEALQSLQTMLDTPCSERTPWVAFLNAHGFGWTMRDAIYRRALFDAHAVYPDGVAIGVGTRFVGRDVRENLPGTDLVPELLEVTAARAYRCYLLGGTASEVEEAARHVEQRYAGWRIAGATSGYFESSAAEQAAVCSIAAAQPDLLLIGMGTPLQERFITRHAASLNARLAICVGGLFGYWSGALVRAPRTVQALRLEWLWILAQQPHKWRRYSIGIARFFAAIVRARLHSTVARR
jgi:N-acetylglucosaminyldiphosphoundecaprenol N-acetyl-beta-D-mannosaminyltransferase